MRKHLRLVAAVCFVILGTTRLALSQAEFLPPGPLPKGPFVSYPKPVAKQGELLVTFRSSAIAKATANLKRKGKVIKPSKNALEEELARMLGLRTSTTLFSTSFLVKGQSVNKAKINSAIKRGLLVRAEPNYKVSAFAAPTDFFYQFQWGLNNDGSGGTADIDVDAPEAWSITEGSPDVVVAVIDTGIYLKHVDLAANLWTNPREIPNNRLDDDGNGYIDDVQGWNFVGNNNYPNDAMFHGTHVAGTVAALNGNGRGGAGVAPKVKLLSLQVLDSKGSGDTAGVMKAIRYAIDLRKAGANIRVLNASLGGGDRVEGLEALIEEAGREGIVFVAAAGNDGNDNDEKPIFPASYDSPNLIAVGAVDRAGNLASFSNYGASTVDVAAPGVGIWSTFPFGFYLPFDGTSMAAPHVAGVAALVASRYPQLSAPQIVSRVTGSVKLLSTLRGTMRYPGIVSARRALL